MNLTTVFWSMLSVCLCQNLLCPPGFSCADWSCLGKAATSLHAGTVATTWCTGGRKSIIHNIYNVLKHKCDKMLCMALLQESVITSISHQQNAEQSQVVTLFWTSFFLGEPVASSFLLNLAMEFQLHGLDDNMLKESWENMTTMNKQHFGNIMENDLDETGFWFPGFCPVSTGSFC